MQSQVRQRQRELSDAQESLRQERLRKKKPVTMEEAVVAVAKLEREPLRQVLDPQMRQQLRRKILLKWHPDKCANTELATKMVQELQNSDDWV